ncbi:MAG: DUF3883 domain-containing protein [Cytophagales bacterium]|nr:DUF3883 domain-containing protein [Cytophagales bacterium]
MKLEKIKRTHVIAASEKIEKEGIPSNFLWSNYWFQVKNKEYPFKYLIRLSYQLATDDSETWLDFESNHGYRTYIKGLGFKMNYYREGYNFFTEEEIKHYMKFGGKPYRKSEPEGVKAGRALRPLIIKLNKWAELCLIEDLTYKKDTHWQWSGTFKSYLWIRIHRPNSSKKVFFAIGISSNGDLFYKIDCWRSNHTAGTTEVLSEEQQFLFDNYLKSVVTYKEDYISVDRLAIENWESLIAKTKSYLYRDLPVLDELETLISKGQLAASTISSFPEPESPPFSTISYIKKKPNFQGYDIDWSKKQTQSVFLGTEGEKWVIEYERNKLKNASLPDKAKQVCKKPDGKGYDILSFDEDGNEIFIEVKTTCKVKDEPFYMSENERKFFLSHQRCYFLYRLFNYEYNTRSTNFYILNAIQLKEANFNATNYEVSLD